MATALEQSIADLCEKHDLLNLGVTFHRPDNTTDKKHFSVSVQWTKSLTSRGCVIEHGETIADALGNAIAGMQAERQVAGPITLADEALPIGEAA